MEDDKKKTGVSGAGSRNYGLCLEKKFKNITFPNMIIC